MLAALCLFLSAATSNAQNFLTPLNGPRGLNDIYAVVADSTGAIYFTLKNQIYRSADNGNTWVDASAGWVNPSNIWNIHKFLALPSGKLFAQSNSGLYRYLPGFNSWVNSGLSGATFSLDAQGRLWSSNAIGIYVSNDDGATLIPLFNYSPAAAEVVYRLAPYSDEHGLFATSYSYGPPPLNVRQNLYHFNSNGEIVLVRDSLKSAQEISYSPYSGTAFYSLHSVIDTLYRSTDGGLTFSAIGLTGGGRDLYGFIYEKTGRIWAKGGGSNGLYKSDDDGLTWSKASFGEWDAEFAIGPDGSYYLSHKQCGLRNLSRSSDGGTTWTEISPALKLPTVYEVQRDAAENLYALSCRHLSWEKSPNEGQTWEDVTLPDVLPSSLAKQLKFVAGGPTGMAISELGHVFYTSNYGADWENATTPPGTSVESRLLASEAGVFYIINPDTTSFKSTDNGETWQQTNFGSTLPSWAQSEVLPNGDVYFGHNGFKRYLADLDTTVEIAFNGLILNSDFHFHQSSGWLFAGVKEGPAYGAHTWFIRWHEGTGMLDTIEFFGSKSVRHITSNSQGDIFALTSSQRKLYKSNDAGDTWQELTEFVKSPFSIYAASNGYLYFPFGEDVIHRSTNPTTTSILSPKPLSSSHSVLTYPNPFDHSIAFEINGPVLPGNATLRLFDALGRLVRREEFSSEKFVVQRHELETGLYYFLLESEGRQLGAGKVMAK